MAAATQPAMGGKKPTEALANVQEEAGGLLLLAAAHETGLLSALETAIASCEPTTAQSLLSSASHCRRQLLLTLLFLPLSGLRRTHDLRSYTGNVLAVVAGRHRAYGYCHTERFLSQLAKANGSEALTPPLVPGQPICGKRASRMRERKPLLVFTSMGTANPFMQTA